MTEPKITKALARRIARRYPFKELIWAEVRDQCDFATAGELDAFQLDLLSGWVREELLAAGKPAHD